MNNSDKSTQDCFALICTLETTPIRYSIETASQLAGIHPEMLRHYCRIGLLGEARVHPEGELTFDDDDLYELRRYERYRKHHGVNRQTLRLLCTLWQELDRLQAELRTYRRND